MLRGNVIPGLMDPGAIASSLSDKLAAGDECYSDPVSFVRANIATPGVIIANRHRVQPN